MLFIIAKRVRQNQFLMFYKNFVNAGAKENIFI